MKYVGFDIVVFLLCASLVCAGDVGFLPYNSSVWQFWNNGPIENSTYINQNMTQIANRPERFGWGNYSDCLISSGGMKVCDTSIGDFLLHPFSDNKTWWKAEGNKSTLVTARPNTLGLKFEQKFNDSMVNRTVYLDSDLSATSATEWFLGWCISNIDVDSNGANDSISLMINDSGLSFLTTDKSYFGLTSYNVTSNSVMISDVNRIRWVFTSKTPHGFSWDGNTMCVFDTIGKGTMTGLKKQTFKWIDDFTCVPTYIGAFCGTAQITNFTVNCTNSLPVDGTCRPDSAGVIGVRGAFIWDIPGCRITGGTSCNEKTMMNISSSPGVFIEVPSSSNVTANLTVCNNPNVATCQWKLTNNVFENNSIQCRKSGFYNTSMVFDYLDSSEPVSYFSEYKMVNCTPDSAPPLINITTINNSVWSTSNISVSCNATDSNIPFKYPLRNISLWWNLSVSFNVNVSNSAFPNVFNSTNLTPGVTPVGNYIVGCKTCDNNGNCNVSDNRTITVVAGAGPPVEHFVNVSLLFPLNNSNVTNASGVKLNCSVNSSDAISNVSLFMNYSGVWAEMNFSSFLGFGLNNLTYNVSYANMSAGFYLWNCFSQSAFVSNWSFLNYSLNVTDGTVVPVVFVPSVFGVRCFSVFGCLFDFERFRI